MGDNDPLAPARGLILGVILGVIIWAVATTIVWWILR